MFRAILFTALICLTSSVLYAQSEQPTPPSNESSEQPQKQAFTIQQEPKDSLEAQGNTEGPKQTAKNPPVSIPESPTSQLREAPQGNGKQTTNQASEFFELFGRKIKITDGLLALFNFLLVVFTAVLVGGTIRQRRLIKKNFVSSQRAFVFLKGIETLKVRDVGNKVRCWKLTPIWENSGYTPTSKLAISINFKDFYEELPKDFNFPYDDFKDVPMMIGPRAEARSKPFDIPADTLNMVTHNMRNLYIWGCAEYFDIFKNSPRRRTEFCLKMFIDDTPGEPLIENVSFFQCGKYNNAH